MSLGIGQLLFGMIVPWATTAAALWLTWWAARSRDRIAFVAIALVLVIVPALISPVLTATLAAPLAGSTASRALLLGVFSAGIALARALFLTIWAIASRDLPYLRIVGVVVALAQLTGIAAVMVAGIGLGL